MKDACYKKVKAQYDVFPSARASQAIAKCRKASGTVKKSEEGTSLKRWEKEKWVDTRTGKACGAGGKNEYCRPSKRVTAQEAGFILDVETIGGDQVIFNDPPAGILPVQVRKVLQDTTATNLVALW